MLVSLNAVVMCDLNNPNLLQPKNYLHKTVLLVKTCMRQSNAVVKVEEDLLYHGNEITR